MASTTATPPQVYTRIRLATLADVGHIHKLINELAIHQREIHIFSATEKSLSSTIFNAASAVPFRSTTVFLLEISGTPFAPPSEEISEHFTPILETLTLKHPITDPDEAKFKSKDENDVVVAGFVLFFPNYSTFLAKPGFHVEDLFVRECFRSNGMGKMLLSAVLVKAAELGFGRVEWTVANWNVDAIRFYENIEAPVLEDWRICRITGQALDSYGAGAN